MIKNLLLLIVLVPALSLKAQLNPGFEDWSDAGGYENPDDWTTLNLTSFFGDSLSCLKSKTSYTGSYCALLRSVKSALLSDTIPGLILQSIPYNSKPNSFRVAYQHSNPFGTDSALISVEFYKGPTDDPNNLIGHADINLPKNTNWQKVQQDITWDGIGTPDTMVITAISGFELGSELKIDDVELSLFSASTTKLAKNPPHVYFSNEGSLYVRGFEFQTATLQLFNSKGQLIHESINSELNAFHHIQIPVGVYFYRIASTDKGEIFSGKVLKR